MADQLLTVNSNCSDTLFDSLDALVHAKETDKLQGFLSGEQVQPHLGEMLAEFTHWACGWIGKLSTTEDHAVLAVLEAFLQDIPLNFDVGEYLLLMTGQLTLLRTNANIRYLLKPLTLCITLTDFARFARIHPVLNEVTAALMHQSAIHLERPNGNELAKMLESVVDFYDSILSTYRFGEGQSDRDAFILTNLLFLFAQPLLVLDYAVDLVPIFSRILQLLSHSKTTPYNLFVQTVRFADSGDENVSETRLYKQSSLIFPSLLGILSYVMLHASSGDLHNCWPLVFAKSHYINLVHPILKHTLNIPNPSGTSQPEDEKKNDIYALRSPSDIVQRKIISRSLELLQALVQLCPTPLNSIWWSEDHVDYLWLLKKLAIQPISGETLPELVTSSISLFDQLFHMSTYSARYILLCQFLDPRQPNEHHGWRGHMITICKDYLHQAWLQCLEYGHNAVVSQEHEAGEETLHLPFEQHCLGQLAEFIFIYPLPSSTDALIDQSSWILAALNMALYVILRCSTLSANQNNTALPEYYTGPIQALLRTSASGSRFSELFLNPLEKELNSQVIEIQARIHGFETSLKAAANSTEKNRLHSELDVQQSILLRLRLLQTTLERVQKAHRDFCSQVIV